MATKKVVESSVVTEPNITNIEEKISEPVKEPYGGFVDLSIIMNMLQEQQKTINLLQEQLKNSGSNNVTEKPADVFDDTRKIRVVNMFDGENLTLKSGQNGEVVILYGYGDAQTLKYDVAANIARMNRSFATKGYFIFEDKEIIKDFGLQKDYEKFVDKKIFDSLDTLDAESLEALYNRTNEAYKNMIFDKFVKGYIDGVDGFRQKDKIEKLSKASGKDVQYTIDEIQKAERMKK